MDPQEKGSMYPRICHPQPCLSGSGVNWGRFSLLFLYHLTKCKESSSPSLMVRVSLASSLAAVGKSVMRLGLIFSSCRTNTTKCSTTCHSMIQEQFSSLASVTFKIEEHLITLIGKMEGLSFLQRRMF